MKKRLFSLFTSLFMVISMIGVLPAVTASALTYGDYTYSLLSDGTVIITKYNGSESDVAIPSTIDGRIVTIIGSYIDGSFTRSGVKSVTIPNSVTCIGWGAFAECTSLKKIVLPNSITKIDSCVFENCKSLENVTIPNSVTSIGNAAFSGCTNLTSITITNNLLSLGYSAFQNCKSLTKLVLPNSITSIGGSAFYNCESLTSFKIPDSVMTIEEQTFAGCTNITNISLGNNIQTVKKNAFADCINLTAVLIPNSIVSIKDDAFRNCVNLKDVYYTGSVQEWCNILINIGNLSLNSSNIHYNYDTNHIHNYVSTVVKPTYAAQGYTLHKCSVCGDEYKDNYTAKLTVPTVTGFKTAATTANAIKVICNKVAGATGYVYYRASAGKWVKIGVSKTNTFTDTKLKAGTSYRYAVKAYKSVNGKNYYSASYPTLWTSTNPATVSFTVAGGVKKAVLKWSKVTGATGYIAYMKTSANGKWVGLTTTKSLTYTKTGLVKGKTYWFTVKAYRTANGKTYNGAFVTKSVKVK